jgi:hypothetical protein
VARSGHEVKRPEYKISPQEEAFSFLVGLFFIRVKGLIS